jgi:hypothetical protein
MKNKFLEYYVQQSPDCGGQEDDDGTIFPKEIAEPDIAYVPCAEPHVLITDLYDKPKDWYFVREMIVEYANQAYAAYYCGMYFASFMCSTSCLEFTLKYEYVRQNPAQYEKFENNNFSLSTIINETNELGLENYKDRLLIINEARNGLFHFNPKKLKKAVKKMNNQMITPGTTIDVDNGDEVIETPYEDFPESICTCIDNFRWSKIAYYAYQVMYEITRDLYGDDMISKHFQEGLDDYDKRDAQGV